MRTLLAFLAFLASSYAAAGIGSVFTTAGLRTWYPALRKPAWTPSGRVIGLVWTLLYTLMAVAAFRTWRRHGDCPEATEALSWYGIQLGLNVAWSASFFGLRRPGLALGNIALLWAAVARWLAVAARVDRGAALLIVPYLAWVSFAAWLNGAVWWLNRPEGLPRD